jgi:diguanylate cyclase (GGDEF)-like protein
MKKDDLKSLVTQMYNGLMENIDTDDDPSKEQVVNYLRDSVSAISTISDDSLSSIEHSKSVFDNAYKEIANKSLSSYKHTNKRFEKLTQLHEETLSTCNSKTIDLPSITEKFNDIQSHMVDEIKKANDIIYQLTTQVENLEKDSTLDSLTKVFNRRALTSHLENICSKKDMKNELHLLIIDIDDFKIINDTHGHIAGDKVLIFLANILKKVLRDGDKIFRFGGEEFVIILNRIDMIHCKKITQRLIDLISQNKLIYKGESLSITVSIGTTKYINGDSPNKIIERADKGLYKAKKDGKNRMYSEVVDGI